VRARGRLRFLIAFAPLVVLGCRPTHTTLHPPCRPGEKCAQPEPPESEEQAWARLEKSLAEGVARVRAACRNELSAEYDKTTWKDVPSPRDPDIPVFRLSEHDVANALKELESTCEESRWIRSLVVRYHSGGAPATLSSDGVLEIHIDPTADKSDPYSLRRQFGWKWK
jgi:hypothetical protein